MERLCAGAAKRVGLAPPEARAVSQARRPPRAAPTTAQRGRNNARANASPMVSVLPGRGGRLAGYPGTYLGKPRHIVRGILARDARGVHDPRLGEARAAGVRSRESR